MATPASWLAHDNTSFANTPSSMDIARLQQRRAGEALRTLFPIRSLHDVDAVPKTRNGAFIYAFDQITQERAAIGEELRQVPERNCEPSDESV